MKLEAQVLEALRKYRMLIFAVSIFCIFFLVLRPVKNKFQYMNSRIATYEQKFIKMVRILSVMPDVNECYRALSKVIDIKEVENFTESEERTQAFRFLNIGAKKTNMTIESLSPQRFKSGKEYSVFPIVIVFEGSLESIVRFIYYVENSPQLMRVKEINIRPVKGEVLAGRMKIDPLIMTVSLMIFFFDVTLHKPKDINKLMKEVLYKERGRYKLKVPEILTLKEYLIPITKKEIFLQSKVESNENEKVKPLTLTGYIFNGIVQFDKPYVAIFKKSTKEQYLVPEGATFEDIIIKKIERDRIIVEYYDEEKVIKF